MSFKKRATKSIAIALIGVSVGSPLLTTYVSAQTNNISTYYTNKKSVESYTDESLGAIYDKVVDGNKTTITIKSLDGKVLNTLTDINNEIYLDGKKISVDSSENYKSNDNSLEKDFEINSSRAAIRWGKWQYNTMYIKTGGLATATIAGLIALKAGWTPVGGIAVVAAAVAGKYDKLTIKYKIRYGSDGRYNHYERVTTFYGDGKYIKAFTDRGKRY
ncbi:Uncharacterised protein [[Clostridium] sordellii]|uniref:Uncharacterized protein n=1 Tax=Paraclostridium sordellii TaxID=1505 RepID=A0ABM9RTU2_PARSO|nr:hypothetical protein [Paeniclostridium sordellii]TAN66154.1 hypothetical protein WS9_011055 [Paeniclostridium sordellii 8483]CEJ75511.1 hypothetical protein ATCC9714PCS11_00521 (plasmid) [[Clostridium] sordellii] [Paeniclostridium sordellii]CEN22468.1 Uncharacterised protein [[Clostridium] sordellii] [Paeniclostridium sordellii]CEN29727.1 Uncharacterised protein [[Clostridium] sordellii] [Paeniclostridium sordellii]